MRHYHLLKNQYHLPTINIDKVSWPDFAELDFSLISAHLPARGQGRGSFRYRPRYRLAGSRQVQAGELAASTPRKHRTQSDRQLGKGRINTPFIVKTRFVSALAEKKIKEAGGVVKIVA